MIHGTDSAHVLLFLAEETLALTINAATEPRDEASRNLRKLAVHRDLGVSSFKGAASI
jgi:hypothetical protein